MSRDDAASWQDPPPLNGATEQSAETDDAFGADSWDDDLTDSYADPGSANLFSAEIENVNASDWDVDTALIWGADGGEAATDGGGDTLGLDLSF